MDFFIQLPLLCWKDCILGTCPQSHPCSLSLAPLSKAKRLLDWDSETLTREAKALAASKAKEELIHHLTLAGRCPNASREAGPQHMLTAAWEDKCHSRQCPPSFSSSLSFCWWEGCYTGWNIPLVSLGQLFWLGTLLMPCLLRIHLLGVQTGKFSRFGRFLELNTFIQDETAI